jgi:hypothetical protein
MDKLRTMTGQKTDDLLNKGGLLNRHENIKGLNAKTIEENSKELIRNNLPDIDLKYTKKVLDEAVANYDQFENQKSTSTVTSRVLQEQWIAPRLHNALRLTRDEASNSEIWNYLAIYFSDYIRHRWSSSNKDHIAEYVFRYVYKDRHQLAKLWWSAEMTRNGSNYHELGGILSADFINQMLGVEDSRFQLHNLAIINLQNDIFGDGLVQTNDLWNRAIFIAVRKKVAPEPITSKISTSFDLKNYTDWLNSVPSLSECKHGGGFPIGPSDFSYSKIQIEEITSWIREALIRMDKTIWETIRNITMGILENENTTMSAKEIYEIGINDGKFFAGWQKEQIPFACQSDVENFEVNGTKIKLLN